MDLRCKFEKAGKPAALDVVVANAIADDVLAEDSAPVVLDLLVALRSLLRREQIRTSGWSVISCDVYKLPVAGEISQWQTAADGCLLLHH